MDIQVNKFTVQNLYRMETYTDQTAGTIYRQIPVTLTGERDPMRQEFFGASCMILVRGQSMPINFPIENVTSLEEAIAKFPEACVAVLTQMQEQALRQKILTPGINSSKSIKDLSKIDLSKIKKS